MFIHKTPRILKGSLKNAILNRTANRKAASADIVISRLPVSFRSSTFLAEKSLVGGVFSLVKD
jgi:hypothetical protein